PETLRARVVEKAVVAHVGNEDVLPAIIVVIAEDGVHGGGSLAVGAKGYVHILSDVGERAVVVVMVEVAVHGVVGDVDVRPAVVVVVARRQTHGPSQRVIDARLVGYVGKRPIAVVVEEAVGVAF